MSDIMIAESAVDVLNNGTAISSGTVEVPTEVETVLSETQEQALQTVEPEVTPYSDEEIAALKAEQEDEANLDPEKYTLARMDDVRTGKLTEDQFAELMGMSYADCLTELGEAAPFDTSEANDTAAPGMGHNKPPTDPTVAEVVEKLKAYKPKDATNSAEANERVREAMNATVEYLDDGETSLASKGAIAIADWIAFNAGLINNGNKLIQVNIGMYRQVLDNLSAMVDPEIAADTSFKTTVGQMTKRGILIMDGKLDIGYFVVPADKKRVSASDAATLAYPNDVPDGAKVKRSTVIREGILVPQIPVMHPRTGEIIEKRDNSAATELRLVNKVAVEALWASLWDRDGELQYHPIKGHIMGFKPGKQLQEEEAKAKAALAKAEADKANANKAPATRQTGGTQAEGANLAEQNAALKERLAQATQDAAAAVDANKGGILSALNGLGAYIRDTSQPMPEEARITFWKDANAMFARRLIGPNVKPSRDELRELTKLIQNLDNHLKWDDDKGVWRFLNVDGHIAAEFGTELSDKAVA
jgi:hypothetical protein